ncbi:periplasmic substrate-binding sensor histidine kinase response regulator, PBPb, PAS and Hist_Kin_Sens domain-containing [Citrifermentans bemidjiense Bem]|uniref:histidine kinase n=1 Tax=Citrifermentans bemidjiense (strain ATCC BAA-1014 / DSM 16622 / JCM 12645 / Bem) TaxID=404380 RepID=B5EIY7_CITBB|nr:PocR ligand-binding domain-containing protein [Citrifermentans bemidjiense]ACH39942.1 periplasmic substrate-binding sensor histidine kinase response regulator, PBPb, PAS and Hist_Kin_Sens domain-containing [Citrifermentans bemidjiense Bem]
MRRLTLLLAAFCFLLAASAALGADSKARMIRVAAFNFYPCIFQQEGKVQGGFVDLIDEVARREGWKVEYLYGDWADGISRIKNGEVDLLTAVAWTPERSKFLDYSKTPLLTVWGELYVRRQSQLSNLKEIQGKSVAVMKADFNGASFRNMIDKFGISCRFVEYGNFEQIFDAVSSGKVDAGVVNNTFGTAKQHQYGLASSGIIFNPFDIYLAAGKGENVQVLAALDRYLAAWRAAEGSPYHLALKRWSYGNAAALHVTPQWLFPALIGCVLIWGAATAFIVLLRRQVNRKTREMARQAEDRLRIEETLFFINECGARQREDELLAGICQYLCACLDTDYAFVGELLAEKGRIRTRSFQGRGGGIEDLEYDLLGAPCQDVVGKALRIHPSGVRELYPLQRMLQDLEAEGYAGLPLRDSQGNAIGILAILSRRPLANLPIIGTVLRIAGARMAQELEAMSHLEDLNLKDFTIENINDAVYWVTPQGSIWYANHAASAMLGYSREEFLCMAVAELNPAYPMEVWNEYWQELKLKGTLQLETAHRAKDGRMVPVEITSNYCSYNGTEFNCATVRDIAERKHMELALEHRLAVLTEPMVNLARITVEDLFDLEELQAIQDSFAESHGVASLITDAQGRPVTRPSNFCELCEVIRGTEAGLANCRHSDAALVGMDRSGPCLQPCLSGGLWDGGAGIHVGGYHVGNWLVGQVLDESCDLERMVQYADEIGADPVRYRDALSRVQRMSREQFEKVCRSLFQIAGQLSRMAIQNVQQAQHIADRVRSEELLLEYRKVIECSQDQICVIDRDYRYRIANRSFLEYRRMSLDEVVGRTVAEVLGEELFAEVKPQVDECLAGNAVSFEIETESAEQGARSLAVAYNPIEDKSGSIRVACVISDQTEKKHLGEQLRQSQKMEAVGHLAGGIAHDFNNILTVIVGYGNLLEMDGSLTPHQKEQVEQIVAASERGAQLTRGLLTFSRRQIMNPCVLDLNALVNQIQKFLLRIIGEDIRLRFNPHPDALNVWADASQLEQILMNLATNARDAMPQGGGLSIETGVQEIDEAYARSQGYGSPGRYACMMVSDTGEGMDQKTRERIFEPFFSTKVVGKGTGLGMSIVYGIVKQHKGFINVYSEPGEGTAFKIYLPLIEREAEQEARPYASDIPEMGSETILLAEDDSGVRRLVESLLEQYGYRVILAADGSECVQKYFDHRDEISLILMDVIMPGKNGREAFEEIRTIDPKARVLYSSGYTADFMKIRGVFEESVDLVMKPVQPVALLKKVREVLDR